MSRSIIRVIRAVFDRESAKKTEAEMERSLASAGEKGGKKSGDNFVRELRAAFDKRKAQLSEQLARGTINQKEFKKQIDVAAKTFNDGMLKGIEEARRRGELTDREYVKLTRSIKRVGDEGQASIGGRLTDALKKAALAAAALFGLNQIRRFGQEALRAGQAIAAGQLALQQQLRNTGVAWEDVRDEVRETARALWDTHALTAGEVDQTLRQLIVVTNDYETSLRSVGLVHDIVAATGLGVEQAARLLGRALNGETTVFRRYGLEIDATRDVLGQLTERFEGAARAGITPAQELSKAWGDFKEQLGLALMESADGASIFDTLTDSVRAATDWVARNTDAFVRFFNFGVRPVARGLQALARAVNGVAKVFVGTLFGVLSAGAHGLSLLASAAAMAERAKARFLGLFSPERAAAADRQADAIQANADALKEWARAAQQVGRETILEGLFPDIPETADRPESDRPGVRTGTAGGDPEVDQKELDRLKKLEEQREALIQQMARDIEIHGRRVQAYQEGEEAVEALNRQLHIEEAVLRSGAEAGSEFEATIRHLAAAQYDAAAASAEAAALYESSWTEANEAVEAQVAGLRDSMAAMFLSLATGGIKGIARFAKVKALENVAHAIENFAKAKGWIALGNVPSAAAAGAAAKEHLLAAAKWGAVGGAAGMGGGGGGAGPSVSAPRTQGAAQAAPQPITYVFIDPLDPHNPVYQRNVAATGQSGGERFGSNVRVRPHPGGGRS